MTPICIDIRIYLYGLSSQMKSKVTLAFGRSLSIAAVSTYSKDHESMTIITKIVRTTIIVQPSDDVCSHFSGHTITTLLRSRTIVNTAHHRVYVRWATDQVFTLCYAIINRHVSHIPSNAENRIYNFYNDNEACNYLQALFY
jgi:hypothetical protein